MFEEEIVEAKTLDEKTFEHKFATRTLTPKSERLLVSGPQRIPEEPKQRRLMLAALALLIVALCVVFYRDRDFWFPGQDADPEETAETAPASRPPAPAAVTPAPIASASNTVPAASAQLPKSASPQSRHRVTPVIRHGAQAQPEVEASIPPPAVVSNRTVLPPLEVEVVAGDTHKTVRPGTNSIHVELQPGTRPQPAVEAPTTAETPQASGPVTSNAAERVQMSAGTTAAVANPVKPGYPLLARQMKVQGSVILRALISKDGSIQNLHLLSGPRILASAAEDAVRQWHFKPHYVDDEPVETQAKITVNFTISTN